MNCGSCEYQTDTVTTLVKLHNPHEVMQPGNKHCPAQLDLGERWIFTGEEAPLDMFIISANG